MNTLIIDNEELFSNGLSLILNSICTSNENTKCLDISQLNSKYNLKIYDLIILNINLFNNDVSSLNNLLKNTNENCKIVILNNHCDYFLIDFCKKNHIYGYLLKTYTEIQFKSILTLIISGTKYFPSPEEHDKRFNFTSKQIEIIKLIKSGLSNKQIAYELKISECTVKVHISHIFKKCKCYNRVQLINITNEIGF